MTISFKYKSMKRPNGVIVKSPVIPLTLSGRSSIRPEVIALLDSGADLSIVPEDMAELLDLDTSMPSDKSKGIGGEVEVKTTKMNIELRKTHETYSFQIPVQVVLGDSKLPVLIGRAGFFDRFRITFDQRNQVISLKPNSTDLI